MDMTSGLDELIADFDKIIEETPQTIRELHEDYADLLKRTVDSELDSSGKVASWQQAVVGSRGGYAAIHPIKKQITPKWTAWAITYAINYGHKIMRRGNGKNYRPRIKVSYVDGNLFYNNAKRNIENTAIAMAEKTAEEIAKKLG